MPDLVTQFILEKFKSGAQLPNLLICKFEGNTSETVEFPSINEENVDFPCFQGKNFVLSIHINTFNNYLGDCYVHIKYNTHTSIQICVCVTLMSPILRLSIFKLKGSNPDNAEKEQKPPLPSRYWPGTHR